MGFTPRERRFIELFTDGEKIAHIARRLKMSRDTVYRWLKDNRILKEIERRLSENDEGLERRLPIKAYNSLERLDALAQSNNGTKQEKLAAVVDGKILSAYCHLKGYIFLAKAKRENESGSVVDNQTNAGDSEQDAGEGES